MSQKPKFKQGITDRKMRLVALLVASGQGIISPIQIGQDAALNVYFNGRAVYDYTDEEFEAAIGPYEERIRQANGT